MSNTIPIQVVTDKEGDPSAFVSESRATSVYNAIVIEQALAVEDESEVANYDVENDLVLIEGTYYERKDEYGEPYARQFTVDLELPGLPFGEFAQAVMHHVVVQRINDDPYSSLSPAYDRKAAILTNLLDAFLAGKSPGDPEVLNLFNLSKEQ